MTEAEAVAHLKAAVDVSHQTRWAYISVAPDAIAAILAALERETKRLDWLETQREAYGFADIHEGNRWMVDGPFGTLRAAVDAALSQHEQGASQ